MRRLVSLVAVLTLLPVAPAFATELDEILERTRAAEYSAEQIISCSTPYGAQDAFVRLVQADGELTVSSNAIEGAEVSAGAGLWTLTRPDGLVTGAAVEGAQSLEGDLYDVSDASRIRFLGRDAEAYRLERDGELRAELVVDTETGALVQAVTFTGDGEVYCTRRFVSIDGTPQELASKQPVEISPTEQIQNSMLPESVAGFVRLDHYEDEDGFTFAYYSDGFFSFALFETPASVDVPGGSEVEFESGAYTRAFNAGQVSYAWDTRSGGMALIGDLPPDLHEGVLSEMPSPDDPGLLRRWWRSLFG